MLNIRLLLRSCVKVMVLMVFGIGARGHSSCELDLYQMIPGLDLQASKIAELLVKDQPDLVQELRTFWQMEDHLNNLGREVRELQAQLKGAGNDDQLLRRLTERSIELNQLMLRQSQQLVITAKQLLTAINIPTTMFYNTRSAQHYLAIDVAAIQSGESYPISLLQNILKQENGQLQVFYNPYVCQMLGNYTFYHPKAHTLVLGDLEGLWFAPSSQYAKIFNVRLKHEVQHIIGALNRQRGISSIQDFEIHAVGQTRLIPQSAYEKFLHGEEEVNFRVELQDLGSDLSSVSAEMLPRRLQELEVLVQQSLAISRLEQQILPGALAELERMREPRIFLEYLQLPNPLYFDVVDPMNTHSALEDELRAGKFVVGSNLPGVQVKVPYVSAAQQAMAAQAGELIAPLRSRYERELNLIFVRYLTNPHQRNGAIKGLIQKYNQSEELKAVAAQMVVLYQDYFSSLQASWQQVLGSAKQLEDLASVVKKQLDQIGETWPSYLRYQAASAQVMAKVREQLLVVEQQFKK